MNDTSPEIDEMYREMFRKKTGIERLRMGFEMYEFSRNLVIHAIRQQKPDISPAELRQQVFLRFYGHEFSDEEKEKILKRLAEAQDC